MLSERIKELKKEKGLTTKDLIKLSNLPERTVIRVINGETKTPYADTLLGLAKALGVELSELLGDSDLVVGNKNLNQLQDKLDLVTSELEIVKAENEILKNKTATLSAELDLVKMELRHKEELLAIHNYYTKLNTKGE
jgi:transcriptional regulator with XRE-family HTH domain